MKRESFVLKGIVTPTAEVIANPYLPKKIRALAAENARIKERNRKIIIRNKQGSEHQSLEREQFATLECYRYGQRIMANIPGESGIFSFFPRIFDPPINSPV